MDVPRPFPRKSFRPLWLPLALVAVAAVALWAGSKEYMPPHVYHAKTYPAVDAHAKEQFAIAADPYDMPDKAAATFRVEYRKHGILPVFMLFSNDGDKPISLADMSIDLVTVDNTKLMPLKEGDIFRRISEQRQRPDQGGGGVHLPIPGRKKSKGLNAAIIDEVEAAMLRARAVEPHATQAGFVFFDVSGIQNPLAGAHLYVNNLVRSDGQELFYFDIPMEKYLTYQPDKTQP
jgi:hypothetical protein